MASATNYPLLGNIIGSKTMYIRYEVAAAIRENGIYSVYNNKSKSHELSFLPTVAGGVPCFSLN